MALEPYDSIIEAQHHFGNWCEGISGYSHVLHAPDSPSVFGGYIYKNGICVDNFFCIADAPAFRWLSYVGGKVECFHRGLDPELRDDRVRSVIQIPGMQRVPSLMDPASLVYWLSSPFFKVNSVIWHRYNAADQAELYISSYMYRSPIARLFIDSVSNFALVREHYIGDDVYTFVVDFIMKSSWFRDSRIVLKRPALPSRPLESKEISIDDAIALMAQFNVDFYEVPVFNLVGGVLPDSPPDHRRRRY